MNPKVSILTCIYNGEKYLRACIDSLLKSNYSNFEIICVNDGSTDRTLEVLSTYKSLHPAKFTIISREKKGLTVSLNEALHVARGEYIARLDADDEVTDDRLEKQVAFLDGHSKFALVGSNAKLISENGHPIGTMGKEALDHETCVQFLRNLVNCIPHSSWMARREILLELGGYDPFYKKAQDYEFLLRLSRTSYQMYRLNERLLLLRKTPDTFSYDDRFLQYRFALVAWTRHFVCMGSPNVPTNEIAYNWVSKWFEASKGPELFHAYRLITPLKEKRMFSTFSRILVSENFKKLMRALPILVQYPTRSAGEKYLLKEYINYLKPKLKGL